MDITEQQQTSVKTVKITKKGQNLKQGKPGRRYPTPNLLTKINFTY